MCVCVRASIAVLFCAYKISSSKVASGRTTTATGLGKVNTQIREEADGEDRLRRRARGKAERDHGGEYSLRSNLNSSQPLSK